MTPNEYFKRLCALVESGAISEDTFNEMMGQSDAFCDEYDEWDSRFPKSYCEIEYDDMESEEAVRGCAFDDANFLRYFER